MMEKLDIEDLAANIMKFTVDKNGNVQIALEAHSSDVDLEKLKALKDLDIFVTIKSSQTDLFNPEQ
ncbi:hypothetical protein [Ligilactobacillus ruminis]|jgi:hypothetical protein|uniref:Uncharacterized protein n=1 Tax=Ligilactobacillus ruminis ATCC 25644 TaxID=525362 RepID=E7FPB5_9LACO|nr:hypothetical protein [Ligilactobacillus ruminis]EFZ35157.1 hypothetical protein HMPREF0542_10742 [Ligilactobacillus ruminis ATCC 25644]EGX97950.1 hypothetical protein ANHS_1480 [Ligilactobacillus ruminis ATCC 25644]UWP41071.1 hypothetical protein NQ504_05265 [Ligilactobacillus ruminis]